MRFPTYQVVDLFAGPGGWSLAAQRLGLREIGVETDKAAHLTRRAAGFHTIRASVTDLGPEHFPRALGLIASPPCQTFSMAGKGAGRKALETVLTAVEGMARGLRYPLTEWEDARTGLVLEPLRWALDAHAMGRPFRWIALEQVPTVLPVWQALAPVLEDLGYSVAVGNLQAEQFGVPQTRKRAILIASLDRQVSLPTPTHSRYHTRSPQRLDPDVLPWVSMAQALGRDGVTQEAQQGMGMLARAGRHERPRREDNQPSFTITGADGGGCARLRMQARYRVSEADGSRQNAPGSVRVSVQEAGTLQSFPWGFPWQGSKTKRYQQVGNAIPPLLAEAVLRAVI